jgi:hypothetical protein
MAKNNWKKEDWDDEDEKCECPKCEKKLWEKNKKKHNHDDHDEKCECPKCEKKLSEKKLLEKNEKEARRLYKLFSEIRDVQKFTKQTGAVAAVFKKVGAEANVKDFVYISTTVPVPDQAHSPATNIRLSRVSPQYNALLHDKSFVGPANLFGINYFTKYAPDITDADGVVIALSIGFIPLKY